MIVFSLCELDSTFIRAAFIVILLSSSAYIWYNTKHYAIGTGHANRLTWERLKSNLQSYFKHSDYAYQI